MIIRCFAGVNSKILQHQQSFACKRIQFRIFCRKKNFSVHADVNIYSCVYMNNVKKKHYAWKTLQCTLNAICAKVFFSHKFIYQLKMQLINSFIHTYSLAIINGTFVAKTWCMLYFLGEDKCCFQQFPSLLYSFIPSSVLLVYIGQKQAKIKTETFLHTKLNVYLMRYKFPSRTFNYKEQKERRSLNGNYCQI